MRWIALLLVAVLVAVLWAMSGDREPDTAVSEDVADQPVPDVGEGEAVTPVSEVAPAAEMAAPDVDSQSVATTEPTNRPLALNDEMVSESLPIDWSRTGEGANFDPAAETDVNGVEASNGRGAGSGVLQEIPGPGGDPIQANEVGPGQAYSGPDSNVGPGQEPTVLGPEFDDPVSLAPEFEAVDMSNDGPGGSMTTEPLPGPGHVLASTCHVVWAAAVGETHNRLQIRSVDAADSQLCAVPENDQGVAVIEALDLGDLAAANQRRAMDADKVVGESLGQ